MRFDAARPKASALPLVATAKVVSVCGGAVVNPVPVEPVEDPVGGEPVEPWTAAEARSH
jgi:hypothetical protein